LKLTQKETELIKDLKGQEQLCIDKYTKHSSAAKDVQLKNLFTQLAQTEQKHFDTLTQIENGTVPTPGAGSSQQPAFTQTYTCTQNPDKQNDCFLCTDLLTTEKHASHLYDTCVFEFKDDGIRNTLNHIQKEEQQHGKMIYDYMAANCMYN